MFESIEKDHSDIFRLTIRITYLLIAVGVDIGVLYVAFSPGSTKEERFGRFLTGALLLSVSVVLSAPVLPYVVWKLVKHKRPLFWGIALLIAAIPILMLIGAMALGA